MHHVMAAAVTAPPPPPSGTTLSGVGTATAVSSAGGAYLLLKYTRPRSSWHSECPPTGGHSTAPSGIRFWLGQCVRPYTGIVAVPCSPCNLQTDTEEVCPSFGLLQRNTQRAHDMPGTGLFWSPGVLLLLLLPSCAAVSPIITTVAGIYQNQTPNFIISYTPYKGYPQLLGDGGLATAAPLGNPWDVVQDESGNLYFVDFWVGVVRRVDNRTGVMTTIAGNNTLKAFTGDGGPASKGVFQEPSGLALWQGCLYVADSNNGAIRRINLTTNIITTVAGTGTVGYSGDGGLATSARLNQPRAVAIDPRNGDMLIAEYAAPRVRRVSAATGIITTVAGNGTLGTGRNKDWGMGGLANATAIAVPIGITVDAAGNVYFACDIGSVVQKIDTAGRISIVTGKLTNTNNTGDKGPAGEAETLPAWGCLCLMGKWGVTP